MSNFTITYHKNKKFGAEIVQKTSIQAKNAKSAVEVFVSTIGNLKKMTIHEVQEYDKKGNPVGEPIVPMEENAIVPVAKGV